MNPKKIKYYKYSLNNKKSISFSHIKFLLSLIFFPKKWWSFGHFFFPASEALKIFWGPQKQLNFWILDLWVYLKKVGLEAGLYGKSVLYLLLLEAFTDLRHWNKNLGFPTGKIRKLLQNTWIYSAIYHKLEAYDDAQI